MRHFEAVKMACALMDDPSTLVELVCQKFVDNAIHNIRRRLWYGRVETLRDFAQELKEKSLDPLCNSQFYYVTELPLKRRSRMYVFDVRDKPISDEKREIDGDTLMDTCVVCIERSNVADQEVLKVISDLNQPITDLFTDDILVEHEPGSDFDKSENGPFRLDSTAGSIRMKLTTLPLSVQNGLGQQLASAEKLEILEIPDLPFIVDNLLSSVHTKTNLKLVNFYNCRLSEDQYTSLCEQFKLLPCLVSINLGKNRMSYQSLKSLTASLRSWGSRPLMLYLVQCDMYSSSCTELLEVLALCTGLQKLDISANPIGGAFAALHPRLVYPSLMELETRLTRLSGADILALGAIMRNNGMPQLWKLQLGYNSQRSPRRRLFTADVVAEALEWETAETWKALKVILDNVKNAELWVDVHKIEMRKVDMETARKLQVMLNKVT